MNFKRDNSHIRPVSDITIRDKQYFIGLAIVPIIITCILILFIVAVIVLCTCGKKVRFRGFHRAREFKLFLVVGAMATWLTALGISASFARYDIDEFVLPFKTIGPMLDNITFMDCAPMQSDIDSARSSIVSLSDALDSLSSMLSLVSKVIDIVFLVRTILAGVIAGLAALTIPSIYRCNIYSLVMTMLVSGTLVTCLLYILALFSADLCYPDVDQNLVRLFSEIGNTGGPTSCSTANTSSGPTLAICYYQTCDPQSEFATSFLHVDPPDVPPEAETQCPGITANIQKATAAINQALDGLTCENVPYVETIRVSFCKKQLGHQIRLFYAYISAYAVTMFMILVMLLVEDPSKDIVFPEDVETGSTIHLLDGMKNNQD